MFKQGKIDLALAASKLDDSYFQEVNPSKFRVRDFYFSDEAGLYRYHESKDLKRRCANMFESVEEGGDVPYLTVYNDKDEKIDFKFLGPVTQRFLTNCKMFIIQQVEKYPIHEDKSIYIIGENEIFIDSLELVRRMRLALLNISYVCKIILEIEENYILDRSEWQILFCKSIINMESVFTMLEEIRGRTYCHICNGDGVALSQFTYEDKTYKVSRDYYLELRFFDADCYTYPVWSGEHDDCMVGMHHKRCGQHDHVRVYRSENTPLLVYEGKTIEMKSSLLAIIRIFINLVKSKFRDNCFGTQFYSLYPVGKLLSELDNTFKMLISFWFLFMTEKLHIKYNTEDSIAKHLMTIISIIKDEPIIFKEYKHLESKSEYIKSNFKIFSSNVKLCGIVNGSGLSNMLFENLRKRLELFGCKCNSCKDIVFPELNVKSLIMKGSVQGINDLRYLENIISEDFENELVNKIDSLSWDYSSGVGVQQYGYKYDYKSKEDCSRLKLTDNIPEWLNKLITEVHKSVNFNEMPNQITIEQYQPGEGQEEIIYHRKSFGDTIMIVNLLSSTRVNFTNGNNKIEVFTNKRSLLIMSGLIRAKWSLSIDRLQSDFVEGKAIQRSRRVSIMLRVAKLRKHRVTVGSVSPEG